MVMLSVYQFSLADQVVAGHRNGLRAAPSTWASHATLAPINCSDAGTDNFPASACGPSEELCASMGLVRQACQRTCKLCAGHASSATASPSSPGGGAGALAGAGARGAAAAHGAMIDASDLAAEQAIANEKLEIAREHNKTLARAAAKRAEQAVEQAAKSAKVKAVKDTANQVASALAEKEAKVAAAKAEAKRRRRARSYVPMYAGDEDEVCADGSPRGEHHDAATLAQLALASELPLLVHSFFSIGVGSQIRFVQFVVEEAMAMGAVAVLPLWVAAEDGNRGGDAMRVGRLDELWRMRNYVERLHCFSGVLAVLPTDVGLELRAGSSGAPQDSRLDLDALRARVGDGRLLERSEAPLATAGREARQTIVEQLERGSAAQHARPAFFGPPLARGQTGEDWMQRLRAAHGRALLPSEPLATRFGLALDALARAAQAGSGAQFSRTQFVAVQPTRTDHTAGEIRTCRPEVADASADSGGGGAVERILSAVDVGVSAGDRASTVMYVASVGRAALPRLARRGWQAGKTAFTLEMLLPAPGSPTGRRLLASGDSDDALQLEAATAAATADTSPPPPGTEPAMPPAAARDATATATATATAIAGANASHGSAATAAPPAAPPAKQQAAGAPREGSGVGAASAPAACADKPIPKAWPLNTCEKQLLQGKCDKPHNKYPGGFCPLSCGLCGQLKSADAASVTDESVVGPDTAWLDEALDLLLQAASDTLVGNSECEVLHSVALMRCRAQTPGGLLRASAHAPPAVRGWLAANTSNMSIAGLGYSIVRDASGVLVYNRDKVKGLGCPRKLA